MLAWIQVAELEEKSMEPPDQELQFAHLKFAVIWPLDTLEPSRSVICVSLVNCGMLWPELRRGETVTLLPSAEVYTINMWEPDMELP